MSRGRYPTMLSVAVLLIASAEGLFGQGTGWSANGGDIRVLCPLTIGGSFEAKTRSLAGSLRTPATPNDPYIGELTVDLITLDTGIGLRNKHLREAYLETDKGGAYSAAVISNIHVAGVDPAAAATHGTFTGILRLHGTEKMVAGQVEMRRKGSSVHVSATFPVRVSEFGIAKPRYLGVGVRDEVQVRVTFDATT